MTDITVGSRVRTRNAERGVEGVVEALDSFKAVFRNGSDMLIGAPLADLFLIPDTVTPTLLREDAEWLVNNIKFDKFDPVRKGYRDRIVAALKEAL